jgi:hypothetical protein
MLEPVLSGSDTVAEANHGASFVPEGRPGAGTGLIAWFMPILQAPARMPRFFPHALPDGG